MKKIQDTESSVTVLGQSVRTTKKDPGDIIAGLIIITVGIILLGNNLGLISWQFWETIIRFWPLLFILMGVQVILGNSLLARLTVFMITLALLFVVVVFGLQAINWPYLPTLPLFLTQIIEFLEGRI